MSIRDRDVYNATPGKGPWRKLLLFVAMLAFGVIFAWGIQCSEHQDRPHPGPSVSR